MAGKGLTGASSAKRPWPAHAKPPKRAAAAPTKRELLAFSPLKPLPDFVPPQLATLVHKVPQGDAWLHEIKFDGYRGQIRVEGKDVEFLTRKGLPWGNRFKHIMSAAARLGVKEALIDGEAVVLDKDGRSDFGALQEALTAKRDKDIVYFAFDLLHLDGHDLRNLTLDMRKRLLRDLIGKDAKSHIQFSDHMTADGAKLYQHACDARLEGIVSKLRGAPYVSERGENWVKIKCVKRQEFVVGGWRPYAPMTRPIGSLLVGYFKGKEFVFAGKVGTGLNERNAKDLLKRLKPLARGEMPFASIPKAERKPATWVDPRIVVEVEFAEWTRDGQLRHPSFKGTREDKSAREVTFELPKVAA
jgi:bifunctional non-homologous end joining protein LigD